MDCRPAQPVQHRHYEPGRFLRSPSDQDRPCSWHIWEISYIPARRRLGLQRPLQPAGSGDVEVKQHFFIAANWISLTNQLIMSVAKNGGIIFAKRSELIIIKRGLGG